ncbi:MAG TPA: hypothetical protein VKX96_01470, partial [Chloroflexota bacterium]|nr:hypothetical protein [Chloroflexota bacterium]
CPPKFGSTGAVTRPAPATFRADETDLLGSFEVIDDERRLIFQIGERERWVIDPRRFGGAPKLKVERSEHRMQIELIGAFYPGTNFPADFVGELRQRASGWWLSIYLALGGFRAEVPFERWLLGNEPAGSTVNLIPPPLSLGSRSGLIVRGHATAELLPDWTLKLHGAGLARLIGLGDGLVADSARILLLAPKSPSILRRPAARRTAIDLARGDRPWSLDLGQTLGEGWQLFVEDCPFTTLRIEASEPQSGPISRALLAEAEENEPKLFFQTLGKMAGQGSQDLKLPLLNPRYAVAFDPSGDETALFAMRGEASSPHATSRGASTGGGPPGGLFELLTRQGTIIRLACGPALRSLAIPCPQPSAPRCFAILPHRRPRSLRRS